MQLNSGKIYFFETEKSEEKIVRHSFKQAQVFREAFSAENADKCADAQVLCVMIDSDLSARNLKKCKNLKLIVTRTVGYNHIDLQYAKKNGIVVCNVPDYGSHVIAEHVFALLLSAARNILQGELLTASQQFSWKGLRGMALKGKTLGVVGTGNIGLNVCRIASLGFQMKVLAYDINRQPDRALDYHFEYVEDLHEIWKKCDIISLHLPLFPATQHLINAKTIRQMKNGVTLINTARGGLIDTKALVKAIKAGKFRHVALDVIEHETNLKEDQELLTLPNVIITPHIAFYADDSINRMYEVAIKEILDFSAGQSPLHRVEGS